mgnify:CR=1 FL=1
MKEHTPRGHYFIVRGLIPIVFGAKANQYDPDRLLGTYSINGNTILDYVVDLRIIFERHFIISKKIHGDKRAERLREYLDGRPITSYYWHQRKELRQDLKSIGRRIRIGGYPVKE